MQFKVVRLIESAVNGKSDEEITFFIRFLFKDSTQSLSVQGKFAANTVPTR